MIPKNSSLQQTQFVILDCSIKLFVPDEAQEINLGDIPIEMEFDVFRIEDSNPFDLRLVLSITGNDSNQVPGYKFDLKVGGEYRISQKVVPDGDEYKSLIKYSALACLINESRVFLQTITSFLPFGPYIMPMVDLNDLIVQKRNQMAHHQ